MAPRDSAATSSTPKRKTSGPVILSTASEELALAETPRRGNLQVQSDGGSNNTNNDGGMATPGITRNKRRGSRRFIFWSCAIVLVVVVIILIEDEAELRRTDARVGDTTWKGLPEKVKSNQGAFSLGTLNDGDNESTNKDAPDDDLFINGFGSRSERFEKEKSKGKSTTSRHKSVKAAKDKSKKNIPAKKKFQPFPVIQYDDDNIPQAVAGSIIHAADALLCRDSVVDYVINATDLKDECDGLKKAFTKHCADEEEPVLARSRHRRLSVFGNEQHSENPVARIQRQLYYFSRRLNAWCNKRQESLLMAEDRILDAWDDAAFEVEQGWDLLYRHDDIAEITRNAVIPPSSETATNVVDNQKPSSRILVENVRRYARNQAGDNTTASQGTQRQDKEDIDEDDSGDEESEEETQTQEAPASKMPDAQNKTLVNKDTNKHAANLMLPINSRHVSDKMLSETLMLQQDHKIMKSVQNQTNHTVAQADAAASVKAVSDAADMVSNILNDPTSVEARTCCTSILNVFHENCNVNEEEELSDVKLFVSVVVIAFCGLVKSLIRHFSIRWLPEAAGCILVGVTAGYMLTFFPHHDISFDGNWFLRIMVPPIVFEAALSIDKRSFNRHIVPILLYAVVGTLLASGVTAVVVHEGSYFFRGLCETIPYPEALAFGALISSIDPIAVLSVLSNMGMTDLDTIYVIIFGESLLNDGVAIVLFETLVHFLDDNMEVDSHAVTAAAVHFLVVFIGSLLIGVGSGLCCTVYYWLMHGCQTPLVEILMFLCWALLPYYVCDGIEWSGIVAVVAAGIIMDVYVVGAHSNDKASDLPNGGSFSSINGSFNSSSSDWDNGNDKDRRRGRAQVRRPIFSKEGLLGTEAKTHIGFVTEIIATMMETAIFAYLGLFLFSSRYHWNFYHVLIAIGGCCVSRAVMIPSLSFVANWITKSQQVSHRCRSPPNLPQQTAQARTPPNRSSQAAGVVIDKKMQLVLWFAGLRGAMSFALVEHIPQYDNVTGEGTRLKSELKAMTSACIIFTVFVLGGGTYYMMEILGMAPAQPQDGPTKPSLLEREMEMIGLLRNGPDDDDDDDVEETENTEQNDDERTEVYKNSFLAKNLPRRPGKPVRRQRPQLD
jgi:NhaP-type Na+/H+ or K+/H+ antiporter